VTPRSLDLDVVRVKLDAIERTRTTLGEVGEVDVGRLATDPLTAAGIERLLSRLVDLAVDVNSHVAAARLGRAPSDYRESFELAVEAGLISAELADELKGSVGLRNVIVHEYVALDLDRVATAVPLAIDAYGRYVTSVARALTSG
jgi:uncharacterized protein YutE (UPF0331/DUF86 family)